MHGAHGLSHSFTKENAKMLFDVWKKNKTTTHLYFIPNVSIRYAITKAALEVKSRKR